MFVLTVCTVEIGHRVSSATEFLRWVGHLTARLQSCATSTRFLPEQRCPDNTLCRTTLTEGFPTTSDLARCQQRVTWMAHSHTGQMMINQFSHEPLCCHTVKLCHGKHIREKGSHQEPTGHRGGPWVTLGDHDQGLRGQTLSTKGLLKCSIDQGHGPLSGRSSGFQRQRVTPVWATQWPPGSGSQGDPCGAQSKGVTSSDGLPRFKMLSSANIASCLA